jgi:hypothetical protein
MEWLEKLKLIGVLLFVLVTAWFSVTIIERIEKDGLKSIVEEIWEGE